MGSDSESDFDYEEFERGKFNFKHLPYSDCINYERLDLDELRCDSVIPNIDTVGNNIIPNIDTVGNNIIVIKDSRVQ